MEEDLEARMAGSEISSEPEAETELSALRAEIAAIRESDESRAAEVSTLRAELETARQEHQGEMDAARQEHEGELSALRARLVDAQQERLDIHRRALLAEHGGQVVAELVTGSTVDELEASVESARAAYARVLEAARRELGATSVPVGASPRGEPSGEELSPIAKITAALNRH